jgi:hypothetical protein
MQSPTMTPCGGGPDIGPLATLGRQPPPPPPPPPGRGRNPRAASEPRGVHLDRRRSPRRQPGGGTPANPAPGAEGEIGAPLQEATGSPAGLPSAPPASAAAGSTAASADDNLPSAVEPAGLGQTGAGEGGSTASNSGGRPLWT